MLYAMSQLEFAWRFGLVVWKSGNSSFMIYEPIFLISRANALVPPTPLGEGLKPGMVHVGVGQLATWCDPALASRFPT